MKLKYSFFILLAFAIASCTGQAPQTFTENGSQPEIFPDYRDIEIPANIAPMNFMIEEPAQAYITVLIANGRSIVVKGQKVRIPLKRWRFLLDGAESVSVQVFARNNGCWTAFAPFTMTVTDEIDPYISYRRIPVAVEAYENLDLCQRSMTDFDEDVFFSNTMVHNNANGTCMNCHHYRNYHTDNMQFHVRQFKGGTVLIIDGELRKVNLKTDSTISAGVYPSWHPTHNYIAYSNNKTHQSVHAMSHDKLEVMDDQNDIILYNIDDNSVSPIENDSCEMECYPCWSADGKTLYYASAHYDAPFGPDRRSRIFIDCKNLHFNIYSKPFDPDTRTWGPHKLVYDAQAADSSMTWPRLSPDGRYMMTTISNYGIYPLYQSTSDLFLFDFSRQTARRADEINSPYADSYHVWSSNSKWVMWSTRREDGVHTRIYFAHIGNDGRFSKPFALPQKDPSFNREYLFAFNLPEFMVEPVRTDAHELADFVYSNDAVPAAFESKRETDENGVLRTTDYRVDGTTSASTTSNGGAGEDMYLH